MDFGDHQLARGRRLLHWRTSITTPAPKVSKVRTKALRGQCAGKITYTPCTEESVNCFRRCGQKKRGAKGVHSDLVSTIRSPRTKPHPRQTRSPELNSSSMLGVSSRQSGHTSRTARSTSRRFGCCNCCCCSSSRVSGNGCIAQSVVGVVLAKVCGAKQSRLLSKTIPDSGSGNPDSTRPHATVRRGSSRRSHRLRASGI